MLDHIVQLSHLTVGRCYEGLRGRGEKEKEATSGETGAVCVRGEREGPYVTLPLGAQQLIVGLRQLCVGIRCCLLCRLTCLPRGGQPAQ